LREFQYEPDAGQVTITISASSFDCQIGLATAIAAAR
jgi:hypothetical protein